MWLIDTETLELREFIGSNIPVYAILSHTWNADEVSFQDFISKDPRSLSKQGYTKILKTCELARSDGLKYAWVDTCCIDKKSSAELTEAINSMFQWYQSSAVCYVFLVDFIPGADVNAWDNPLSKCRWFTRGWTLQELIAPHEVRFFDQEWNFRGNKNDFATIIHDVTRIDPEVLQNSREVTSCSISVRMSWAASRETTRIEDLAYCLLGICDVNMPLLYGEGLKAFTRLQHEVLRISSDLSIFAWSSGVDMYDYPTDARSLQLGRYNALATSPKNFTVSCDPDRRNPVEFSLSNLGIRIPVALLVICKRGCREDRGNPCRCAPSDRWYFMHIGNTETMDFGWGILLHKIRPDFFVRASPHLIRAHNRILSASRLAVSKRSIHIGTTPPYPLSPSLFLPLGNRQGGESVGYDIVEALPENRWNHLQQGFYSDLVLRAFDWGLLTLRIPWNHATFHVHVLVDYDVKGVQMVDPGRYKDELEMARRDSGDWSWNEVNPIFDNNFGLRSSSGGHRAMDSLEVTVDGTKLKVTAVISDELVVWTEVLDME